MPTGQTRRYWLVKSEPDVYSIDDLERDRHTPWEGVRNYRARNLLREMKKDDLVLFYHSSTTPPGIAGIAKVHKEAYPDSSQFDPKSDYYDAAAKESAPRWFRVDVAFVEKFPMFLPLEALRDDPVLEGMPLLARGQRLSVQPVAVEHFEQVVKRAKAQS
jgi:predicted RNA-binding protein with PUA-like domain